MEHRSAVSAQLRGNWTITGEVRQITHLKELSGRLECGASVVCVDCSGIEEIDTSGFQLLYTWLHCLQIRGFQPRLVEVPDVVQNAEQFQGLTRSGVFRCESANF